MANKEYELYFTVAEYVPYVQYVAKAIKILDQIYNFGTKSEEEKAIEKLVEQVGVLQADIAAINRRVDELNRRLVQGENLARWRQLGEHQLALGDIALKLKGDPDVNEFAEIANVAYLRIVMMLDDTDLWLWSDIGQTRAPNGQPVLELTEPEFKVLPLPVFAALVTVFAMASSSHIAREPAARQSYSGKFARIRTAVSVRSDWVDLQTPPESLPEKVRSLITVRPFALTKYVTKGECVYGLVCVNEIDRTTRNVRDVAILARPDATPTTMCTAPANLGFHDEAIIEDDYVPIKILGVLEQMLDRLVKAGSLADPPDMYFPDVTYHALSFYAVEPGGQLIRFDSSKVASSLAEEVKWQSSYASLGSGWDVKAVVPGHENILYAVKGDNSITWNRHDGALMNTPSWSTREVAPARLTVGLKERYIAGTSGTIYRSVRGTIPIDGGLQKISQLTADRHPGVADGTGEFQGQVTIHAEWPEYSTSFGDSDGVIYGIDNDGVLFWHKHVDGNKPVLKGPHQIGHGWNMFTRTFSAGWGFIFGIYPTGKMIAYHFKDWRHGPSPDEHPRWTGPVSVEGGGWNAFVHLVPTLQVSGGGVK